MGTDSRYISTVNIIPSTLYIIFLYILIESGSWQHLPNWSHAFESLMHLSIGGAVLLVILGFGLGVVLYPLQPAMLQLLEGYWGTSRIAQAIRSQSITRYQRRIGTLKSGPGAEAEILLQAQSEAHAEMEESTRVRLRSLADETRRANSDFPPELDDVMPTRLGNVLRRAESLAGRHYGIGAVQVLPHLLFIAPASHVDYVKNQRSQLDLAVRMTFISLAALVTAFIFLWHDGVWLLVTLIPYTLAYLSYRGSVVAARGYGSAIDSLINLDRFMLYEQLRLRLPDTLEQERILNRTIARLLAYDIESVNVGYQHAAVSGGTTGEEATVMGKEQEQPQERVPKQRRERGRRIARCPRCGSLLRSQADGWFDCWNCGMRFPLESLETKNAG